jgi:Bacterial Ig domain/FG-GAP-like repeat/FG-GAP repeat
MTIITPSGPEFLVNTVTADNQAGARTVQLAGGRFMVVWTGSYLPGAINTTNFANADVRAQIFNANGTPFGSEFVVNTTTSGVQIYPTATLLSDGHVLVTWVDGIGQIYGGPTAPQASLRGQEYDANGAAVGGEFVIANAASNAIPFGIAATAGGGFVAVYQGGGTGGAAPIGNIVGQIFDASNTATGSQFIVDNTGPLQIGAIYAAVESDGNIIVSWRDFVGAPTYSIANLSSTGVVNSVSQLPSFYTVNGVIPLASGGHAIFGSWSTGTTSPTNLFILATTADGLISDQFTIATLPAGAPVNLNVSPLANGGAVASWIVPDATGTGVNLVTQAFNAIGNPIGSPIAVNTTLSGNQSGASIVQLTNGDFAIAFTDTSMTGGDTSGNAIRAQIFHVDPTNQAPVANDFTARISGPQGVPYILDPYNEGSFVGENGYDADGDPLVVTAVSGAANGSVVLNPDGTLTINSTPGAAAPLSFNYTISDGLGGTATARATLILPDDYLTLRLGNSSSINFLANDFYIPTAGASAFSVSSPGPVLGGNAEGRASITYTPAGVRIAYDPLGATNNNTFGVPDLQSSYFNLLAGQTTQVSMLYFNNEINASVYVTLQGWAQLGGTGADTLTGTAEADHLSGGTGAANTLSGGAGNDWYTVATAGDVIVENTGEGIDSIRTNQTSFILGNNVENLYFVGNNFLGTSPTAPFTGTGNNLDNIIYAGLAGTGHRLSGLAGNDRLYAIGQQVVLSGGSGNDFLQVFGGFNTRYIGGTGNDTVESFNVTAAQMSILRLANGAVRFSTPFQNSSFLRGIENIALANATQTVTAYAAQDSNGDGDSDGLYFSQSTGLIYRTDFVNGAAVANTVLGNMGSGDWDVQASGDFNYDGTSDLVLKNAVTGQFYVWTVTNGLQTGGFNLGTIGTNWNIASTGDFNTDGNHDLLWRDSSNGHLYVWTFNASGMQVGSASLGIIGTDWTAGKAGDFDGDGDSDVLLRNSNTGQVYIYTMQSGLLAGGRSVGVFGTDWGLAATGDFNGDGISDIILKNSATGQFYEFLMNSDGSSTGVNLGIIGTDWNIATSGDYNKDGTDDILWRNANTGQVYLWAMEDGLQAATGSGSLGPIVNDLVIV